MSEAKKELTPHKWVYDNRGGGHRGEYDFTCMVCGATDWISGAALAIDAPRRRGFNDLHGLVNSSTSYIHRMAISIPSARGHNRWGCLAKNTEFLSLCLQNF